MSNELRIGLFNIYDVVVFENENGIVQDCVCAILKDSIEPEIAGVVQCNIHSISIYNGSYKVWKRDGKDLPYYTTNKKIIHLYTLKNDNRFYEIYPTNDYEVTNINKSGEITLKELVSEHIIYSNSVVDVYEQDKNNPHYLNRIFNGMAWKMENHKVGDRKLKRIFSAVSETISESDRICIEVLDNE